MMYTDVNFLPQAIAGLLWWWASDTHTRHANEPQDNSQPHPPATLRGAQVVPQPSREMPSSRPDSIDWLPECSDRSGGGLTTAMHPAVLENEGAGCCPLSGTWPGSLPAKAAAAAWWTALAGPGWLCWGAARQPQPGAWPSAPGPAGKALSAVPPLLPAQHLSGRRLMVMLCPASAALLSHHYDWSLALSGQPTLSQSWLEAHLQPCLHASLMHRAAPASTLRLCTCSHAPDAGKHRHLVRKSHACIAARGRVHSSPARVRSVTGYASGTRAVATMNRTRSAASWSCWTSARLASRSTSWCSVP